MPNIIDITIYHQFCTTDTWDIIVYGLLRCTATVDRSVAFTRNTLADELSTRMSAVISLRIVSEGVFLI